MQALASALIALGCSAESEPERPGCIELSPSCAPLYEPIFDELFTRTLKPTCAQGGGSCHGPDGARGGLVFEDPDEAFALLHAGRLVAGDAACSEIVVRTHDTGKSWSMPPGQPLSESERCVIRRWIEAGAVR